MNNKITIAITGSTGVIGKELLKEIGSQYDLVRIIHNNYSHNSITKNCLYLDLSDTKKIEHKLNEIRPDYFIHLAAITHIDNCEKDRKNGKSGLVWKVNVDASKEIATYCSKNNIPLIYLSTECVFDGKKKFFEESDKKNPINWYGYTKSVAEDIILAICNKASIVRSVLAYHKKDNNKTIYGKILNNLLINKKTLAVGDQLFTPTYTKDIVKSIELVIKYKLNDIYHVTPSERLSPYEFAVLIANANGYSKANVIKTTLNAYYGAEKASLRLKNSCLSSEKSIKIFKFIPLLPKQVI